MVRSMERIIFAFGVQGRKKMWFWRKKKEVTKQDISDLSRVIGDLSDTVGKILRDQMSLRGYVNKKMGNKLKYDDDEEDEEKTADPLMARFCSINGVSISKLSAEEIEFIRGTHEFKNFAEGQI